MGLAKNTSRREEPPGRAELQGKSVALLRVERPASQGVAAAIQRYAGRGINIEVGCDV